MYSIVYTGNFALLFSFFLFLPPKKTAEEKNYFPKGKTLPAVIIKAPDSYTHSAAAKCFFFFYISGCWQLGRILTRLLLLLLFLYNTIENKEKKS
jgi:hypothetical protein